MEQTSNLTFSTILEFIKMGDIVCRTGWNGKGMYLIYVKDWDCEVKYEIIEAVSTVSPFIAMKTADNKLVPWLASQTDILADDWMVL